MQIYLYGVFSLVLLAQSVPYEPNTRPNLIAFGFDGFDPGINRSIDASDTREKLLQRFGEPRKLEMRKEPDKRDPTVLHVEVCTWQWEGLEIITARPILHPGYDEPNRWIKQITLIGPRYKLKFGLSIGSPREAFIEKLGRPWREGPEIIRYWADYYASEGGASFVSRPVFYIEFDGQNRANRITWTFKAD